MSSYSSAYSSMSARRAAAESRGSTRPLSSVRPTMTRESLTRMRSGGGGGLKEWLDRPGVSGVDYEKYAELFYVLAFAVILVLAFYFRDNSVHTKNLSYASLVVLALASLSSLYAGYKTYRSKNLYYGIGGVLGAIFAVQAWYVYQARDDVAGASSLEQERANMLTGAGALVGAVASVFVMRK